MWWSQWGRQALGVAAALLGLSSTLRHSFHSVMSIFDLLVFNI